MKVDGSGMNEKNILGTNVSKFDKVIHMKVTKFKQIMSKVPLELLPKSPISEWNFKPVGGKLKCNAEIIKHL